MDLPFSDEALVTAAFVITTLICFEALVIIYLLDKQSRDAVRLLDEFLSPTTTKE